MLTGKYQIYTLTSTEDPETVKYIGYTKVGLIKRLQQHINTSKKSNSLKNTWIRSIINKKEFVIINLLEDNIINIEKVKKKEIEYIKIYTENNIQLKNGTLGGDCIPENFIKEATKVKLKKVTQYDLFENKIKEFASVNDAAKELKINPSAISKCLKGIQITSKKYIFAYNGTKPKNIKEYKKLNRKILPIVCVNILNNETIVYNNEKELAKSFGLKFIHCKKFINSKKLYKNIYKFKNI